MRKKFCWKLHKNRIGNSRTDWRFSNNRLEKKSKIEYQFGESKDYLRKI